MLDIFKQYTGDNMRDPYFREDENELPYLVSQKRDDDSFENSGYSEDEEFDSDYNSSARHKSGGKSLDDILNSIYLLENQRLILKNELAELLNCRDCTRLDVKEFGFGSYSFVFTRENEYIKTMDEFLYDSDLDLSRTFSDCYTTHNYDKLIRNPRFVKMIEKTGMEFSRCSGGYESEYSFASDKFSLKDEINVRVIFKVGSRERSYGLDLDRMELSKDYNEFNPSDF